MNTSFTPPPTFLCMRVHSGLHLDVAFIPIPVGTTPAACVSYLKEKHCEVMRDSDRALEVLNLLDEHFPKTSRVIILTDNGGLTVSGNRATTLRGDQLSVKGDVLLCCRNSTFGMSDFFPKDPFTGKCSMVDAEEAY